MVTGVWLRIAARVFSGLRRLIRPYFFFRCVGCSETDPYVLYLLQAIGSFHLAIHHANPFSFLSLKLTDEQLAILILQ